MKYLLALALLWHSLGHAQDLRLYNLGELLLDYDVSHYPKVMDRLEQTGALIEGADIVFGNLETAIEPAGLDKAALKAIYKNPSPRVVHHTPASAVDILRQSLGVNLLSMANNHSFDLGLEGLIAGIETLEEKSMAYAGTGYNREQAHGYRLLKLKDKTVALFAFSNITLLKDQVPLAGSIPSDNAPGLYYIKGTYNTWDKEAKQELLDNISRLKKRGEVDAILVSGHIHYTSKSKRPWGADGRYPTDIARAIIDAGADAFLVEGPHAPKGFEVYNNKPIFYGVGNLIFNTRKNVGEYAPHRWYSYITDTLFTDGQLAAIRIIPMIANPVGLYGDPNSLEGKQAHFETRGFGIQATGTDADKVLSHIQQENRSDQHDFTTSFEIHQGYGYWPNKQTYRQALNR